MPSSGRNNNTLYSATILPQISGSSRGEYKNYKSKTTMPTSAEIGTVAKQMKEMSGTLGFTTQIIHPCAPWAQLSDSTTNPGICIF